MFEWLKKLFSAKDAIHYKIKQIADRIKRFMDRFEVAEEEENYLLAEQYYTLVSKSDTAEEAKHYENEFYKKLKEKGLLSEKYEQSKYYADDDYMSSDRSYHSGSLNVDEAAATFYVMNENSDNVSSDNISGSGGEFGGGGASDSWEETGSDNS